MCAGAGLGLREALSTSSVTSVSMITPSATPTSDPDALREYLAFQLADEYYALPLGAIREILKPPAITPVPRTPGHVLGIISVRGRVTTVFDLRRKLRVAEAPHDKHTRVLLVDKGDEIMGLLVDRVLQVYRLAPDEIELSGVVAGDMSEFVHGIGRPRVNRTREMRGDVATESDILILLEPTPLLRK